MSERKGRRPLKIAMLVNDFPRVSQTFVLSQITGLMERGHEISIFSRNAATEKVIHADLLHYKLFRRWTIIPMRQGKFNTLKKRWGDRPAAFLLKDISKNRTFFYLWKTQGRFSDAFFAWKSWRTRYDVIHAHFGPAGHWGLFLKEIGLLQGPLTVSIRGYDIPQQHTSDYDSILWTRAEIIQPSSQSLADSVKKCGCPAEKCEVIYSGLNLERFPSRKSVPSPGKEIRILSVGRLVEKKGLSYALEAFALFLPNNPGSTYTILGDGPLRTELEKKCADLGISGSVTFKGSSSQPEILEHLNQSHIFWAVSVKAANGDVEGDLNTVKESLAVGIPTIATRHGGIPEIIDHGLNGILVPERDPAALAAATVDLLANPGSWAGMAENGRKKMEQLFEHNKLIDRLENIYYQMAEASKSGAL